MYTYIYIYIYILRDQSPTYPSPRPRSTLRQGHTVFIDGMGTPDPNPRNLANRCFEYNLGNLTFSKLVIWGSSWVRGFRYHCLRMQGTHFFRTLSDRWCGRNKQPAAKKQAPEKRVRRVFATGRVRTSGRLEGGVAENNSDNDNDNDNYTAVTATTTTTTTTAAATTTTNDHTNDDNNDNNSANNYDTNTHTHFNNSSNSNHGAANANHNGNTTDTDND